MIATFLADSGVATRGLPWTTGNNLPIAWDSPNAVANPDQVAYARGLTLARAGKFIGTAGDRVSFEVSLTATGSQLGLARLSLWIPSLEVTNRQGGGGFIATREMVESALKAEGLSLQPIKCSREKEGASYGNLIDAVKAPGKTASGLWWMWDNPRSGPTLTLTVLYRGTDMNEVECAAPVL
ncbi:MAG: hypothetical protein ACT4OZ_07670 [Gemmatimonadota bacterium]